MMIDPFHPDWQLQLARWHADLPQGSSLFMLIDGAFIPGLSRQLGGASKPILLFESLPSCNDDTKDVSPFLIPYDPRAQSLALALARCDRHPMVSVIETAESMEKLGRRLAAWCVVEADELRFNFRFPDTRRLPAIFKVLTAAQRHSLVGSANSWAFVGRDGQWQRLPIESVCTEVELNEEARLDEYQFSRLVADSEADEIWMRLRDRSVVSDLLPSKRHALLSKALQTASEIGVDNSMKLRWCAHCLANFSAGDAELLQTSILHWLQEQTSEDEEPTSNTV